ncbi:MAG: type II toxin-antitoxin system prevent-host-death family antitoxin [Planctomyces sp.]|nr:type II toxin-antitoxin system prevent-host-death family antitoxin [Planctomyces sp.]
MDAITYSAARANLAKTMDRVCDDHEPLIITRSGQQSVVMLSLEDFQALEETAYLLKNPANARRLVASISQLNAGNGIERELPEASLP